MVTSIIWQGLGGEGNGHTRGQLARVGSPVVSVLPRLATPSTEHGPHSPQSCVSFSLSERALRLGRCRGAVLGSHGLGTQHWWLQWLERLKLQSTAHGWLRHRTGRVQRPASGEQMVSPQHGSDKSTAESHVMPRQLTGPWEAAGASLARAGHLSAGVRCAAVMTQGLC